MRNARRKIWLKKRISCEGLKEPRFCTKIACVKDATLSTLDEIPDNCDKLEIELRCKIAHMTAPGQWLASKSVIVTDSSDVSSIQVGVCNGSAC